MKNAVLFSTLFLVLGVSALNAQAAPSDSASVVQDRPVTDTLEHFLWLVRGSN